MFFKRSRSFNQTSESRRIHLNPRRKRLGCQPLEARMLMYGGSISMDLVADFNERPAINIDQSIPVLSTPIAPQLNSDPDATNTLFLDFDGYAHDGSIGSFTDPSVPAFSMDSNYISFSTEELQVIEDAWKWVAEDFSPFDVNVTTVDPGAAAFENGTALRVAIGGESDWYGDTISGVSIGSPFINDAYPNVVWTFSEVIQDRANNPDKKDGDGRRILFLNYLANTISHEAGHGYGLAHHSEYDASGVQTAGYTGGEELRTPIMGSNRARDRATWDQTDRMKFQLDAAGDVIKNADGKELYEFWKTQNDMEVIAEALGYRADDHGASITDTTSLKRSGISSLSGSGVIERIDDEDWFQFTTTGGSVTVGVNVLEEMVDLNGDGIDNDEDGSLDEGDEYGWGAANLDAHIELYRIENAVTGEMVLIDTADPGDQLGAEIGGYLTSGDYVLVVSSHGHHGDAGQYTVYGSASLHTIEIPTVPEFWPNNERVFPGIDPRVNPTSTPLVNERTLLVDQPIKRSVAKSVDQAMTELNKNSVQRTTSVTRDFGGTDAFFRNLDTMNTKLSR